MNAFSNNVNIMRNDLNSKLKENEKLHRNDITAAFTVAKMSGHMNDKLLYTQVKRQYETQKEPTEQAADNTTK